MILTQTVGVVNPTDIYVRFNRSTAGTSTGEITHTSTGAATQNEPVSGTATNPILTFQEGLGGYTGTVDTYLAEADPATSHGSEESYGWDTDDPSGTGQYLYSLIRFDNIFGSGAGQIPVGSEIQSAILTYTVFNEGDEADVNEIAIDWTTDETWNSFGSTAGVQPEDYSNALGSTTGSTPVGTKQFDVTSSFSAWSISPADNHGWIFRPTGTNGVDVRSGEYTTLGERPLLTIEYIPSILPTIFVTGTPLNQFSTLVGTPSAEQSYSVSGINLEEDITINAPADFEISLASGSGFGTSVTLTQTDGSIAETPVYVRFNPASSGMFNDNISHLSLNAVTVEVAVQGLAGLPVDPTDLVATAVSSSQIDLIWTDNANNEESYEIERSTTGSSGPFNLLATLPADSASYSDTDLDPETEYCYRVYAENILGPSGYSNTACESTLMEQITLVSPDDGATDVAVPATLIVEVNDPEGNPVTVTFWGRKKSATGANFKVVGLPDTQFYSESYPSIYNSQTQWIHDNQSEENIVFVSHFGDVTNTGDLEDYQWANADVAMSILEVPLPGLPYGVPFGIGIGNHDGLNGGTTKYNATFGYDRYAGRDYFGGHYGTNNNNNYELFSAGGMDFIIIHLEYSPATEAIQWADGLLKTYSDRRAIVENHQLIGTGNPASWQGSGSAIYNELKDNPNLFLMLCGHVDGEGQRADLGDDGHTIYTLLADYQGRTNGGNGWLRTMEFSPQTNEILVKTYSPYLDQWETDANSQFTIPYNMGVSTKADFEIIGTNTGVLSGAQTSMDWPDLDPGTEYEWYVTVDDGSGPVSSNTWSFTSEAAELDYALDFGTGNAYVTFGDPDELDLATFTLETWFKREGTGSTASTGNYGVVAIPLVTKGVGEAENANVDLNYFLGIRGTDNVLAADFEEGAGGSSPSLNHPIVGVTPIVNDTWYHAAVTYDGNKWQLFLNGNLENELVVGQPVASSSTQHAGLGVALNSTGNPTGHFDGVLDEVRIWNYARDMSEIQADINAEISTGESGLVARWGLNEGSGTDVFSSITPAVDGTILNSGYSWVTPGAPFDLTFSAPSEPSGLVAVQYSYSEIQLTWSDNSTDETSFEIERSETGSGGPFAFLTSETANTESYIDQNLTIGAEYCYRIKAVNSNGSSVYDGPACATILVSSNSGLLFDGFNDYVIFDESANSLGASSFTIECWFKRTGQGTPNTSGSGGITTMVPLVAKGSPESDGSNIDANYILGIQDGGAGNSYLAGDFEDTNSGLNHPVTGSTPILLDVWYHAALIFDNSTKEYSLYLNGELDHPVEVLGGNITPRYDSQQPGALGTMVRSNGTTTNGYFQGLIDEARIWDKARTSSELQTDMCRELVDPEAEPNLLGYYNLNEGDGQVTASSASYSINGRLGSNSGTDSSDPKWLISTAPVPYYSVTDGNWIENSVWAAGQNAPVKNWSRVAINNEVNVDANSTDLELNVNSDGALTVNPSTTLTVSR